ncbi:MAG: winged helix-turn-helix domain-containing protein [Solirubrobacterales bacterium]
MADPLRSAVVDCLVLQPATAGELADELDAPIEQIRYQIKRLRRAGIVTVHEEMRRRGAVEYVYVADATELILSREEAAAYPTKLWRRQIPQSLRSIFREALEATRAGAFHGHDCSIIRTPLLLDITGSREICEIFEAAVRDLLEAREKSMTRLQKSGGETRAATSVFLFFEMPG